MLAVTSTLRAPSRCGRRRTSSTRPASAWTDAGVAALMPTTNSSPPSRATMSTDRTTPKSRCAASTSTSSPWACPWMSLTSLNRSRSMKSTASARSSPGCDVRSSSHARSSDRFGRSVRGSWVAAWTSARRDSRSGASRRFARSLRSPAPRAAGLAGAASSDPCRSSTMGGPMGTAGETPSSGWRAPPSSGRGAEGSGGPGAVTESCRRPAAPG